MMGKPQEKSFDCVEMKNSVQAEIMAEVDELGPEEAERRHALWLQRADDPLAVWWRAVNGADLDGNPRSRRATSRS